MEEPETGRNGSRLYWKLWPTTTVLLEEKEEEEEEEERNKNKKNCMTLVLKRTLVWMLKDKEFYRIFPG